MNKPTRAIAETLQHAKQLENFTNDEASIFLGLKSTSVLNKARCTGTGLGSDLPYVKIGRRVLYRRADLEEWLQKHLVTPNAAV